MDLPGRQPSACPRQANTFLYCWAPAVEKQQQQQLKSGKNNRKNIGKNPERKQTVNKKLSNEYFLTRLGRNAVCVISTS